MKPKISGTLADRWLEELHEMERQMEQLDNLKLASRVSGICHAIVRQFEIDDREE